MIKYWWSVDNPEDPYSFASGSDPVSRILEGSSHIENDISVFLMHPTVKYGEGLNIYLDTDNVERCMNEGPWSQWGNPDLIQKYVDQCRDFSLFIGEPGTILQRSFPDKFIELPLVFMSLNYNGNPSPNFGRYRFNNFPVEDFDREVARVPGGFMSCVVSNTNVQRRNQIVNWFLRQGATNCRGCVDKVETLRGFKFNLAVENCFDYPFITEKVIDPIFSGVVPVYSGNKKVFDYINRERIIFLEPDMSNLKDVAEEIVELNTDDSKYLKKVNTPPFSCDIMKYSPSNLFQQAEKIL